MILLITGSPGHGKSLFAVNELMSFMKQGRPIYSDIEGLDIENVMEAPKVWTETPDSSVVFYDECQKIFPADGSTGRSSREDIAAMETHRHTGHDLVLITQDPKLLHPHVRRLIGRHHHLERKMGMQYSRLFTADRLINIANRSELDSVDSEVWSFPKELYGKYKSSVDHNVKVRVDTKLKGSTRKRVGEKQS